MATSTIKAPITNYVVVAESGTTSATWAAKIEALYSAYSNMSREKRVNSFILRGNMIYECTNVSSGLYTRANASGGNASIQTINFSNNALNEWVMNASGNSYSDLSSVTLSDNLVLCYRL